MHQFIVATNHLCRNELCYPDWNMNDRETRLVAYIEWLDPHVHCFTCNKMIFKGEPFYRTHKQRRSNHEKVYCRPCIERLYH